MARPSESESRDRVLERWVPALVICLIWSLVAAAAISMLRREQGLVVAGLTVAALALTLFVRQWSDARHWIQPIRRLSQGLKAAVRDPRPAEELTEVPELAELIRAVRSLGVKTRHEAKAAALPAQDHPSGGLATQRLLATLTHSGLFESPPADGFDTGTSGDFSTTEMVSRLEPRKLRWIESSPAEQDFLGWNIKQLREKSFLEIVHPNDRQRAKDELQSALAKGEVHGLIVRIKTAQGTSKAIEMNVGARYGLDMAVTHLRCHVADVTDKVRAERELRLRTSELTQVNRQLHQINRELEELKDRYTDLYQNAPAMYFSLDPQGVVLECNDTMLRTLGYRSEEVVGQSYRRLLPEPRRPTFASRFAAVLEQGSVEVESQWVKSNGEVIDVWVTGTVVRRLDNTISHSRSIAQDVTARKRLEAELQDKNERLARINEELSRKNREMDEFAYVVSHDLQEPLRTLIAFSDFLVRDCGDQLDACGQEYVRYLVEAARRMRSLIDGLLNLSRAGRVTGELTPINLEDVVGVVQADLAELIRTKQAVVEVKGPLPIVWGDRDRIGQLVANLVTNGLKYNCDSQPRVEVGALPDEGGPHVTFFVRDNGIGIDPQFHAKIFQLFRRLHTREEYEGTGAGLAICTKIVQAHGGRIWVESEPNQGATFYVSLPRLPQE